MPPRSDTTPIGWFHSTHLRPLCRLFQSALRDPHNSGPPPVTLRTSFPTGYARATITTAAARCHPLTCEEAMAAAPSDADPPRARLRRLPIHGRRFGYAGRGYASLPLRLHGLDIRQRPFSLEVRLEGAVEPHVAEPSPTSFRLIQLTCSISLGRQFLSSQGLSGPYMRRMQNQLLPGMVWSQLSSLPAGAFGPK